MSNELVPFDFYGDALECLTQDGKVWVAVGPICAHLGIDDKTQRDKLNKKAWATRGLIPSVAQDGRTREVFCLDLESLPMWLSGIEPRRVKEEIRPKLIRYQRECKKALAEKFLAAPPPPAADPAFVARVLEAMAEQQRQTNVLLERLAGAVPAPAAALPPIAPVLPRAAEGRGFPEEPTPTPDQLRVLPQTLLRSMLNQHMQERMKEEVSPRSDTFGMKIHARWQLLYIAFRDRYEVNAGKEAAKLNRERAERGERGPKLERLDALAHLGMMPELVALAFEMWPAPAPAARRVAG